MEREGDNVERVNKVNRVKLNKDGSYKCRIMHT